VSKIYLGYAPFSAPRAFIHEEVTAMTDQDRAKLIRAMDEQAAKNAASSKAARDFLIKSGTYTKSGQLTAEFGGPGHEDKD
jgi:hypothetical protein